MVEALGLLVREGEAPSRPLVEGLSDPDEHVRLAALHGIGPASPTPESIDALTQMVITFTLPGSALESFARHASGAPEIVVALERKLLADSLLARVDAVRLLMSLQTEMPEEATRALVDWRLAAPEDSPLWVSLDVALPSTPSGWARSTRVLRFEGLGHIFGEGSTEVKLTVLGLIELAHFPTGRGETLLEYEDLIYAGAGDSDARVRHMSIKLISGPLDTVRAGEILEGALLDVDPRVRASAVSYSGVRREASVDELVAILTEDESDEVRAAAAAALWWPVSVDPTTADTAIAALERYANEGSDSVREATVYSLAQLGVEHVEARVVFTRCFTDLTDDGRRRALMVLSFYGDWLREDTELLLVAMGDRSSDVRLGAVEAGGRLRADDPLIRGRLKELLDDEDENVRFAAAAYRALLSDSTSQAIGWSIRTLRQADDWSVRAEAARSLAGLGENDSDQEVVDALFEGLCDSDNDVRRACADGLAEVSRRAIDGGSAIVDRLIATFDDAAFSQPDIHEGRPGWDYAFDGVWAIVARAT